MNNNIKPIALLLGGIGLVLAPVSLVNLSKYTPRFEKESLNEQTESWSGAAGYYRLLTADPSTGEVNEAARDLAIQEAALRTDKSKLLKSAGLGLNWSEVGPDDIGGRTRAICFDRKTKNVVFAAGVSGGIFKSTNGGSTWSPINDQLSNMIVSCMAQDASGDNIYFGTGETMSNGPSGDGNSQFFGSGLYKLEIATNNITALASTTSALKNINKVACHNTDNNTIYLATASNGFKISNDAGATWHAAKLESTGATVASAGTVVDLKVGTDNSYIISSGSKIYLSLLGDDFVTEITPTIIGATNRSAMELAIAPSDPKVIYASCVNGSSNLGGVVQTVDRGVTWRSIALSSSGIFDPFKSGGFSNQGFYDNCVTVDPTNPYRLFLGGVSYWKWEQADAAVPGIGSWDYAAYQFAEGTPYYVHSDLHTFAWDPFNSSRLFVGGDGGLSRSSDKGLTYTSINKGFNVTQCYAIAYQRYPINGLGGTPIGGVACGLQDNGTPYISGSYNGTKGSIAIGGGDGNYCEFSHLAPTAVFTSIYYGQVLRSANSSSSGSRFIDAQYGSMSNPGDGDPGFASFVTPIALWEKMDDFASIDSVTFTAAPIINLSAATGNGINRVFKTKIEKPNSSAIFDSLYLSLGGAYVGVKYANPSMSINVGGNLANITVTSFAGSTSYDSLIVSFASAPANYVALKTQMTIKYNSGADVKVSTNTTSNTKFGYNLTANLASRASVRVPDITQARLAIGLSNRVVVVKKPLNFGITPDWVTVASSQANMSRDESGSFVPFVGTVQTMAWDPSGDNLYVGTQSGSLYRISHLRSLKDSVGVKKLDSLNYNGIDSAGTYTRRSQIRCTKIAEFGRVITSISLSQDDGKKIVVTCGTYGSPGVYYATNPDTHPSSATIGLFTSKMGSGSTGLISTSPIYSSLIEVRDTKRVLVGTEFGLYATADISAATPVWSKENNGTLPNVPVFSIRQQKYNSAACYNSGMIYVGTHGRGMWSCNNYYLPSVVGIEEINPKDKTVVNTIKLYPNPAKEMVNLAFEVTGTESLTLNVYDLKGVLALSKNLGKLPEGNQLIQIGTEDLIPGNYIVSLNSSNSIVGTNRLVVVK